MYEGSGNLAVGIKAAVPGPSTIRLHCACFRSKAFQEIGDEWFASVFDKNVQAALEHMRAGSDVTPPGIRQLIQTIRLLSGPA